MMEKSKILIIMRNKIVMDKYAKTLRNSGFSVFTNSNPAAFLDLCKSLEPEIILWGDVLTKKNKELIRDFKKLSYGRDTAVIAITQNLELYDRIDAQKHGVDDFFDLNLDYAELKLKINFHNEILTKLKTDHNRAVKYQKLSEVSFGFLMHGDINKIFESLIDYFANYLQAQFLMAGIFKPVSTTSPFLGLYRADKNSTDLKDKKWWLNYFRNKDDFKYEQTTEKELISALQEIHLAENYIYHIPVVFQNKLLGFIMFGLADELSIKSDDGSILKAIAGAFAMRVNDLQNAATAPGQDLTDSSRLLFRKLSEPELFSNLCQQLIQQLKADFCLYLNYQEGFKFIYPQYMFDSIQGKNLFESEKLPVIMLNEYPFLANQLKIKSPQVVKIETSDAGAEIRKLPGLADKSVEELLIMPVNYPQVVQGYFIFGKSKLISMFSTSDIDEAKNLISYAADHLAEHRVLKQANLTIKQLARIFEIGSELTLEKPINEILKKISLAIRRTLGWNIVLFFVKSQVNNSYRAATLLGIQEENFDDIIFIDKKPIFEKLIPKAQKIGNSYLYMYNSNMDSKEVPRQNSEWNDNNWLFVPIESKGKRLGIICLNDPVDRLNPNDEKIRSVEYFANQAAVVMENTQLFESLRSSELRYRMLAETMTMGLVIGDFAGKINYINRNLVTTLGYKKSDDLIGKSLYQVCEKNSVPELEKKIIQILKIKKDKQQDYTLPQFEIELLDQKGANIPFMVYASPLFNHNQLIGFFGVFSDQREQKRLERLKSDFNSMIVHDLRSPLNIIQGYIDIVATEVVGKIKKEQKDLLLVAKENVYKVLKLIDNFLIASKLEAGKVQVERETASLNGLVEMVVDQHKVLADKKKIKFESSFDENIPIFAFDKMRIEQVITNFLSNALKFTPDKGIIVVNTNLREKRNSLKNNKEFFAQVTVNDSGPGIPKEELQIIFNKYEQAGEGKRRLHKGTGLGLAISSEIVQLHGGEIWAESEEGKGSKFIFTLPVDSAAPK